MEVTGFTVIVPVAVDEVQLPVGVIVYAKVPVTVGVPVIVKSPFT